MLRQHAGVITCWITVVTYQVRYSSTSIFMEINTQKRAQNAKSIIGIKSSKISHLVDCK